MKKTETITFVDCNLRSVTRSYKTHEALVDGVKKELRRINIKRVATTSTAIRERLNKASCDLLIALADICAPFSGRQIGGHYNTEFR